MVGTPRQCYTGLLRLCFEQHCFSSCCFSGPAMEAVAENVTALTSTATGCPTVPPSTPAERGPNDTGSLQQSSSHPTHAAVSTGKTIPEAPRSATDPLTVIVPTEQARAVSTSFEGDPVPNWEDNFVLPDVTKPPPGYPFHREKAVELLQSWILVDWAPGRHIIAFPNQVQLAPLAHNGTWSQPCTSTPALWDQSCNFSHQVCWYPQQPYYVSYYAGVTQGQPALPEQLSGEHRQFHDAPYIQQNQFPVRQGENLESQMYCGAVGSNIEQDGPAALSNLHWGLRGQGAYSAPTSTKPNQPTAISEKVWEPVQNLVTEDPDDEEWYARQLELRLQEQCDASTVPDLPQGQPVLPTALSCEPQQPVVGGNGRTRRSVDSGIGSAVAPSVPENSWRWYKTSGITRDVAAFDDGAPSGGRYHGRHTSGGSGFESRRTNEVYASPVTLWSQQGLSGSNIPNLHPGQGGHGASGYGPYIYARGGSTQAREHHVHGRGRLPTHRLSGESLVPREDSAGAHSAASGLPRGFESDPAFCADGQMATEDKVWRYLDSLPPVDFPTPRPPENSPDNSPAPPYNPPVDNILRPEHFADHRGSDGSGGSRRAVGARRGIRRGSGVRAASSSSSSRSPPPRREGRSTRPNNFQKPDDPETSTDAQAGSSS
ncbi:uncharacterized protein LOC144138114 [Haemaphysalis longicornis]